VLAADPHDIEIASFLLEEELFEARDELALRYVVLGELLFQCRGDAFAAPNLREGQWDPITSRGGHLVRETPTLKGMWGVLPGATVPGSLLLGPMTHPQRSAASFVAWFRRLRRDCSPRLVDAGHDLQEVRSWTDLILILPEPAPRPDRRESGAE
jgi:hypothetical protein